ncbi:hypothetical protein KL918_004320 [Ogataea parapolymorpha]|nr:hypothetical protein KL918_004320 [Ogataea parapolymorpha]KAG7872040.1 hypothetical protein KL916_003378 [Ogataea parapolymorpha]
MTSWARLWLVPEIGNALWVEPGLRPQKKRGWNLGTMHRKLPETSLEATSTVLMRGKSLRGHLRKEASFYCRARQ